MVLSLLFCLLAMSCGGDDGAALGGACSTAGATAGQCVPGGVCGTHADGATGPSCLKVCLQQTDCAGDEDCNGVEGSSLKGCRLKTAAASGSGGSGSKN
jgi:hypothetical protein